MTLVALCNKPEMDGRRTRKPGSVINNKNKTSYTDRLPNEILSKFIYQVSIS